MCIYIYIYIYLSIYLSLSLYIYIYIYAHETFEAFLSQQKDRHMQPAMAGPRSRLTGLPDGVGTNGAYIILCYIVLD